MEKWIMYNIIILSVIGFTFKQFKNNKMEPTLTEVKTKKIGIKKGQSVDFLAGIQNTGTEEALQKYYAEVFPPAVKNGFKSEGAFITIAPPVKGNFHAAFVGIMSWPNEDGRENFLTEAAKLSYDYIAERRNIWSVFNLTQYSNIDKDIEFTVSSDKVYVISAYWIENAAVFQKERTQSISEMEKAGGKLLVDLGKGKSPKGYLYEPDIYSVEEWDSIESFENYKKSVGSEQINAIKNENQWITKFLFPN